MFEWFADRARQVIVFAQDEARNLKHNCLGTEHLLLGLVHEDEGVTAKALEALDIALDEVRAQVIDIIGEGQGSSSGHIPFTPQVKKAIEYAMYEGPQLGHSYIGTEHLLFSLTREPDGMTVQVLTKLGADMTHVHSQANQLISGFQGKEPVGVGGGAREETKAGLTVLDQYGHNLTQSARDRRLDPIIGHHMETEHVMQALPRYTKNDPVLIGEPGVGKTAVVEGPMQAIASGNVPETLRGKQLYSLDVRSLVTGSRYRGDFEDRMKKILKEVNTQGDIMLFIDEIHSLVGVGAIKGVLDTASLLKSVMARGEPQVIGATTLDEYRKHIEKGATLERRFRPTRVEQPTVAQTAETLKGLHDRYRSLHRVTITGDTIDTAASLTDRYVNDRFLPDKAIDLIDETGVCLAVHEMTAPPKLREINGRIASVRREEEAAIGGQDFERAASLRDEGRRPGERRAGREQAWKDGDMDIVSVVDEDLVTEVLSMATGIPVLRLSEAESAKPLRMGEELHRGVIDQNEAVVALSQTIHRTRAGLKDPNHPGNSFVFADPTSVSKTELAKAPAGLPLGNESILIVFNTSEYSEKHAVSWLLGAPLGYVGYDEGGQLTRRIRHRPFSVVLFDEVERVHPNPFNPLFRILEEGRSTDSQGRVVDFKSTTIIMTTNLETKSIAKGVTTGFQFDGDTTTPYERMKSHVGEALKEHFHPEFLDRVDDMIVFSQLQREEILRIVDLMVGKLDQRLAKQEMHSVLTKQVRGLLAGRGYDPILGARPLRRATQRDIEDVFSEKLLFGDFAKGQTIVADVDEENIPVTFTSTPYDANTELPQDVVAVAEPKLTDGLIANVDNRRQGADTTRSNGLNAAN